MRTQLLFAMIVLLAAGLIAAKNEPLSELKAKADEARGGDQAKLCLEYAHRELEDANDLFTKGDVEKAQAEIVEVVTYARKGGKAASTSGKHLKQTEINLRELSKRMHDIANTLAFEDRDPLRKAVDEIEQVRSDLLARMFQS
jgi:hypothetical protein